MATYIGQKISYEVSYHTNNGDEFSYITGNYAFFHDNVNIGHNNPGLIVLSTSGRDSYISLRNASEINEINLSGGDGIIGIGRGNIINTTLNNAIALGEELRLGTEDTTYQDNNYLILGKFNENVSYSLLNIGWGTADNSRKNLVDVNPESILFKTKDFAVLDFNKNELFGVFYRSLEGDNKEILNSRIPFVMSDNMPIYYSYASKNNYLNLAKGGFGVLPNDNNSNEGGIVTNIRFGAINGNEVGISYTRTDISTNVGYYTTGRNGDSIKGKYKLPSNADIAETSRINDNYYGYQFITNISQASNGRISYEYTSIYTPELSLGIDKFVGNSNNTNKQKDFIVKQEVYDHEIINSYGSFKNTYFSYYSTEKLDSDEKGLIKNIHIDANGLLTYNYYSLLINSGTEAENNQRIQGNNPKETDALEFTDNNTIGDRVLTNIWQNEDGKIAYTYQDYFTPRLNTYIKAGSYYDDGFFVNDIQVNDHAITYHMGHITKNNAKATYFVNGISWDDEKNLSYSYYQFTNNPDNWANQTIGNHDNGVRKGIIKNVHLDEGGDFSYTFKSLFTNSGIDDNTNTNAVELADQKSKNTGARFLTNISQDEDGKISYTYHDIYTPQLSKWEDVATNNDIINTAPIEAETNRNAGQLKEEESFAMQSGTYVNDHEIQDFYIAYTLPKKDTNYTYHTFNIKTSPDSNTTDANLTNLEIESVNVIDGIVTSNNDKNNACLTHEVSYHTVNVLTQFGFRKQLAKVLSDLNNIIYAGTYTCNSNGSGSFTNSANVPQNIDTWQCGYVFIATNKGTFMGKDIPVSGGDWIILNKDIAKNENEINVAANWDVINKNFDVRPTGVDRTNNANNTDKSISNINFLEDGEITYTYIDLSVNSGTSNYTNYSSRNNQTQTKIPAKTNPSHSLRVINNISQNSFGKISYTYDDIYNAFNLQTDTNAGQNYQLIYDSKLTWSDDSTYTITNSYVYWWGDDAS